MNEEFHYSSFPNDKGIYLMLHNPCVIDCTTKDSVISLIMDKEYPQYLFLQIDGEFRRCYDLGEETPAFETNEEVAEFLIELSNSSFMDEIIEEERKMNQEWKKL